MAAPSGSLGPKLCHNMPLEWPLTAPDMLGQGPMLKALKADWQAASTSGAVAAALERYWSPVQGSMMGRVQPSLDSTKALSMKICRQARQHAAAACCAASGFFQSSQRPLHETWGTSHCYLALRGNLLASRLASAAELCVPAWQALEFSERVRRVMTIGTMVRCCSTITGDHVQVFLQGSQIRVPRSRTLHETWKEEEEESTFVVLEGTSALD